MQILSVAMVSVLTAEGRRALNLGRNNGLEDIGFVNLLLSLTALILRSNIHDFVRFYSNSSSCVYLSWVLS